MLDKSFKIFFATIFGTTFLPYLPYILPFLPEQLLGFNMTGWAWIIMLLVTVIYLSQVRKINFPYLIWLPWMVYLIFYIIIDYSFIGLQLTLQYILPILVGFVASGFIYTKEKLYWMFKWFINMCVFLVLLFVIGYLFRGGYTAGASTTPMLLSICGAFMIGLYFIAKQIKYIFFFLILFLVPFIDVTRTGIAVFLVIFISHFANRKIEGKIIYSIIGLVFIYIVFNSNRFQEKTFFEGQGQITDLSFDYDKNTNINTSGRVTWMVALEPGLKKKPLWGNGPRADNAELIKVTLTKFSEAHNDYLSVRYNYGYIGLSLLLLGFLLNFLDMLRKLKQRRNIFYWLIGTSTLTLFFSFLIFMYSDNILKYTVYFPNYFFALIGIFYSMYKYSFKRLKRKIIQEPQSTVIV